MLTAEQAAFLIDVLNTQGLSLPLQDGAKLRLAADTRDALEKIANKKGSAPPDPRNGP